MKQAQSRRHLARLRESSPSEARRVRGLLSCLECGNCESDTGLRLAMTVHRNSIPTYDIAINPAAQPKRKPPCPHQAPRHFLVAVPGRRRPPHRSRVCDIERRGQPGIYTPSMFGNMSWPRGDGGTPSASRSAPPSRLRPRTHRPRFRYRAPRSCTRSPAAASASASAWPTRPAISAWASPSASHSATRAHLSNDCTREGEATSIIIAALRQKMVALAGEIAEGGVRQCIAVAHGDVAGGIASGEARRCSILCRQHAADLHQRRCRSKAAGKGAAART